LAPSRVRGFFPRGERAKWTIALQVKYGLTSGRDDSEIMTDYGPEFCGELIQRLLGVRAEVRAAVAAMDEEELGEVDKHCKHERGAGQRRNGGGIRGLGRGGVVTKRYTNVRFTPGQAPDLRARANEAVGVPGNYFDTSGTSFAQEKTPSEFGDRTLSLAEEQET